MKRSILYYLPIFIFAMIYSTDNVSAQDSFHKKYLTLSSTLNPRSYSILYSPWDSGYYSFASVSLPADTGAIFTRYDKFGNIKSCKLYHISAFAGYHSTITENPLPDTTIELLIRKIGGIFSLKVDTAGNLIRALIYPSTLFIYNQYLFNDHIYAIGTQGQNNVNGLFLKHDTTGQALWAKIYSMGPGNYLRLTSATVSTGGGFLLAGHVVSQNQLQYKLILIKTDSIGNIQWHKQYRYSTEDMIPRTIINTFDNGYIIEIENSFGGNSQIIKVNSLGNVLWHFGLNNFDFGNITRHSDSTFISTGTFGEIFAVVIDSAGNLLKSLEYTTGEISLSVNQQYSETRGLIAFTQSSLSGGLNIGFMFLKTDTSLMGFCVTDTVAFIKYNYIITDSVPGITANPFTMIMQNVNTGITVITPNLIETNFCTPSGIAQPGDKVKFSATVYPIPAIDKVVFELPEYCVEQNFIQIYDQTGRIIYSEHFTENSFILVRNHLPAGLYFYQLISQGMTDTGKFIFK